MTKKILWSALALVVIALGVAWLTFGELMFDMRNATSVDTAPADYALQDDGRVEVPAQLPQVVAPYNALKNVYWGDLHVHTEASFDAKLLGIDPDPRVPASIKERVWSSPIWIDPSV